MKIANVVNARSFKAMVAKVFTVGLLAGAVAIAVPTKAQAQVSFGVRVGPAVGYVGPGYRRPIYVAPPAPVYGGFYGPAFHGRFYGRPYWDHRRFR
jgi:hypothetical protein